MHSKSAVLLAACILLGVVGVHGGLQHAKNAAKERQAAQKDDPSNFMKATPLGDLIELTEANFDTVVTSNTADVFLVEFFAPWCQPCHRLLPELAKAATTLKAEKLNIKIGQIDISKERNLQARFNPAFSPYFFVFKNGTKMPFEDEDAHSAAHFVAAMKRFAAPTWKPSPDRVQLADDNSFPALLAQGTKAETGLVFVFFFQQGEAYGEQLLPEFSRAARILHNKGVRDATMLRVDIAASAGLTMKHNITKTPVIKVFARDDVVIDFDVPTLTGPAVAAEVQELVAPACAELKTLSDLEHFINNGQTSGVVGYVANKDADLRAVQIVGERLRKRVRCAWTVEPSLTAAAPKGPGSVTVYQPPFFHSKYEAPHQSKLITTIVAQIPDLVAFVEAAADTLVRDFRTNSRAIGTTITESERPVIIAFMKVDFGPELQKETRYWREKLLQVAVQFKPQIAAKQLFFAIADEVAHASLLPEFNLAYADGEVSLVALGPGSKRQPKYRLGAGGDGGGDDDDEAEEGTFSIPAAVKFAQQVLAGTAPTVRKTTIAPQRQDGPVVELVGSTFDKVVFDKSKSALVMAYSPSCVHCTEFKGEYAKLARLFKGSKDLVVARIDGQANDLPPSFEVDGYPTFFFVNDANRLSQFTDDRSVDNILKFLKDKGIEPPVRKAKAPKTEL